MFKKILFFLILPFFLFSLANAYEYNSSWTDLHVEVDNWCANVETPFEVYNLTQYDNKTAMEENLCEDDETPEDDSCSEFDTISATIKIYDGPFDNEDKILVSSSISSNYYSYTFEKSGQYLVEVLPTGKYNDWYSQIEIEDCGINTGKELYNQTFNYQNDSIILRLTNTNIESESQIDVNSYSNPKEANLKDQNNSIKVIKITGEINYTNLEIEINLDELSLTNNLHKLYVYDSNVELWLERENFIVNEKNIIIQNTTFQTFSIVQEPLQKEEEEVHPEYPILEQESQINSQEDIPNSQSEESLNTQTSSLEQETLETTSQTNSIETTNNNNNNNTQKKESGTNKLIIFSLIALLIIVLGGFGLKKMKERKEKKRLLEEKNHDPSIPSYSDLVTKTQQYVEKYKDQYSQDQIYRALKEAKIPEDVINKIFSIEY